MAWQVCLTIQAQMMKSFEDLERKPPAKLNDRTKVDGEPWALLKKEAMKEKYKISVEYQKLVPYDKETVNRLIEA